MWTVPPSDDPREVAHGRLLLVLVDAGLDHRLSWIEVGHLLDLVRWDCQQGRGLGYRTPFEVAA
jgi:hypothetical protein